MPLPGYKSITIKEASDKQLKEIAESKEKSKSTVAEELINEEHKKISEEVDE